MRDHQAIRMLSAESGDILLTEHLVHRAMSLPQQNSSVLDLFLTQTAHGQIRIPHRHLLQRNSHLVTRPSSKVLVWEEQHFFTLSECPFDDLWCVRRGTNDPAMFTTECF